MDEWISRQHTLLVVAQESQLQSDQHEVVESDADVTDYPINSYVLYTSPNIEDRIKFSPRQADQDLCSQSATLSLQS